MPGNDSFTKVLLHFDGTNGGTTITDSNAGGAAKTWTANSSTTSTTQAKFGTASLATGAGVGWADTPDSADFSLGAGDFTIDCWFWVAGGSGVQRHLFGQSNSALTQFSYLAVITSANVMIFEISSDGTSGVAVTGTTAFTATGWNHFAAVRTSGVLKMFLNGTQEGGNVAFSSSAFDSANKFAVGRIGEYPSNEWNGFIDEFRISVGTARWTTNFTPPAAPYDTNVVLTATPGAFSEAGIGALFGVKQPSSATSYALTGNAALFKPTMGATVGAYSETGVAALFDYEAFAGSAAYSVAGNAATFAPRFAASAASYSIAGNAALFGASLASPAGSYAVTGFPSIFSRDFEAWFPRPFQSDNWTATAGQPSTTWTPAIDQPENWTAE